MLDALIDAVIDTLKLSPILLVTYIFMEYLEHHTGDKINRLLEGSKKAGPLIGSAFGLIPQCGFSGAASGLYASGTITLGALLAVFISTSDEMLPILISSKLSLGIINTVLLIKFITGIAAGYLVDLLNTKKKITADRCIHDFCEQEHCHCNDNIFVSALKHTVKIILLIFIVTIFINIAFVYLPEDKISAVWNIPVVGELFAALIGLIPNCSSSVLITNLYVKGIMGIAPMLSGLIANAGIGLLVLFRVNKNKKENVIITLILYLSGVVFGGLTGAITQLIL